MFDWLLGSSKDVNSSNSQSMHYKYIKIGDERVPVRFSPCNCWIKNQDRGFYDEFVACEFCKEAEKELEAYAKPSTTEWVYDKGHRNIEYSRNVTGRCRVCGEVDTMLRNKPHYKWSWKLGKAVRV